MDRPIVRSDLTVPDPALGPYVLEAPFPADLAARVQGQLAAISAALSFPAVVCSWDIAGGGGGANWRASFDVGLNVGWGLNTSPPVSLCGFVCDVAQNGPEIESVTRRLLAAIPSDAYVWGIKHASSGRDGTYLVGIWYSTGGQGSGKMMYSVQSLAPQGPLAVKTVLASITIPASAGASAYTVREYMVLYSMALNDPAGASGIRATLEVDAAMVAQSDCAPPLTEWRNFSGCHYQLQNDAAPVLIELSAEPNPGNVTVRGITLNALLVNSLGAES